MKFGQNLHTHFVPEWESFYVNYDLLKKLFKTGLASKPPDFIELYTCLRDATDAFYTFHKEKYAILQKREAAICRSYDIEPDRSAIGRIQGIDPRELTHLLESFLELRIDLVKLQWFGRVNQDAMHKVHIKLAPFQEARYQALSSEWALLERERRTQCFEHLNRLDRLIPDIYAACSKLEPGTSLFLKDGARSLGSPVVLNKLYHAISSDRPSAVENILRKSISENRSPGPDPGTLVRSALEFSMTYSIGCVEVIISRILPGIGAIIDNGFLRHVITTIGQRKSPLARTDLGYSEKPAKIVGTDTGTNLFLRILDHLGAHQYGVLQAQDGFGRLPLHYSARYGLTDICNSILVSLHDLGPHPTCPRKAILSQDSEGRSPLHCAVIYNHEDVTRAFLDRLEMDYGAGDDASYQDTRMILSDLLILALRCQHDNLVKLLSSSYVDISHQSHRGQTPLYIAAQIGREHYVKILLGAYKGLHAIDVPETVRKWTPLFVSSANGHVEIVKLLLQAGADQTMLDDRGWTVKEIAAFKGHLTIAGMFNIWESESYSGGPVNTPVQVPRENNYQPAIGQSLLVVNLGAMRNGGKRTAIDLAYAPPGSTLGIHEGVELLLEVSVPGFKEIVQVPPLDDGVYHSFLFPIDDPREARLVFSVFHASSYPRNKGELVGNGTAILRDFGHGFGKKRESLIRDRTVPIIGSGSSDFLGAITFTFVIVEPYTQVHIPSPPAKCPLEADKVQLVGHRGLGQNNASHKHLQLGENTVESFISAARLGASVVELDVQLTKDLVPVIYHDFSLSETGTDVPIHDLSLKQFMYASNVQSPRGNPVSVLGGTDKSGKPRSRSLTRDQERGAEEIRDRMKYTVDFKNKGFKPNTRSDFIQDSFTTLEELLVELPKSLCLNIEIKYPRLHEAVDAGVAPVGIEINTFVDTTLDIIYRFGAGRPIILSSFTPEICILLAVKQKVYPVMLITNAGKIPITDKEMRGGSLQVAIRFAKQWNLAGLVLASETFMLCPRLIKHVKNRGLKCASYGPLNDDPGNVKVQVNAGIDILMADRVGLIAKALKEIYSV